MIKIEPDKKKHFWVGMLMGAVLRIFTLYLFSANYGWGIAITFILIVALSYGATFSRASIIPCDDALGEVHDLSTREGPKRELAHIAMAGWAADEILMNMPYDFFTYGKYSGDLEAFSDLINPGFDIRKAFADNAPAVKSIIKSKLKAVNTPIRYRGGRQRKE